MSERAKPKQLLRERVSPAGEARAHRLADRERRDQLIDEAQRVRRERTLKPTLLCTHNTPWLECTICSKPRS